MPWTAALAPALIFTFGAGILGFGLFLSRGRAVAARQAERDRAGEANTGAGEG